MYLADYIWLDGSKPVQKLRTKNRFLPEGTSPPDWDFDGSSTEQSQGDNADLILCPVFSVKNPTSPGDVIVLCEVLNQDGTPHESNTRAKLRHILEARVVGGMNPWVGFEQEFFFFKYGVPLGFIKKPVKIDSPDGIDSFVSKVVPISGPQGPYYCGVGAENLYGAEIMEKFILSCELSDLPIYGSNAEVAPGQWEFQIGPRPGDCDLDLLDICDSLWIARFLLAKIALSHGVSVVYHPKPLGKDEDFNGSGMHTNFSMASWREPNGLHEIMAAVSLLEEKHKETINSGDYGTDLDQRLTGKHETCDINTFRVGNSDRKASIRIPNRVVRSRQGYLEDRRPGANADPYRVAARLTSIVCGDTCRV